MKGELNRNLTTQECPGRKEPLEKGEIIYKFQGETYGWISPNGVAVTSDKNGKKKGVFYEVPIDAIEWDTSG